MSTFGVVPMLDQLNNYTDVSLAVSLHAANDDLRDKLVPINKKYPIAMLLNSVRKYLAGLPDKNRKATIEYTLIRGINDSDDQALELTKILHDVPCKINLIPFNPFDGSSYEEVSKTRLYRFRDILVEEGYIATIRSTRGGDIDAACGQLAGVVNDRTQRSIRHLKAADAAEPVRFV